MYNAQKPTLEELPSTERLLKSTAIAAGVAAAILFTVVLPAEYNVDPIGVGRILGLTEIGEIKQQLAEEAEADRQAVEVPVGPQSSLGGAIMGIFVGAAFAQEVAPAWTDTVTFELAPGEGTEIKLVMQEGTVARFEWTVAGGVGKGRNCGWLPPPSSCPE